MRGKNLEKSKKDMLHTNTNTKTKTKIKPSKGRKKVNPYDSWVNPTPLARFFVPMKSLHFLF